MQTVHSMNLAVTFVDEIVFPKSRTCLNRLVLPSRLENYQSFKDKMDKALKFGSEGYSFLSGSKSQFVHCAIGLLL